MTPSRKTRASKKASLPPRRLRMNREARLVAAVAFLRGCNGENLIRRYARWFGVNVVCAALELRMLGKDIDPADIDRVRAIQREKERAGRQRNERRTLPRPEEERAGEFEWEFASFTDDAAGSAADNPF